jgi:hypothetical protein
VNEDTDSSSPSSSSSITKIVSPLAAFAGLILIGGIWMSRKRKSEESLDQNENLMKHTCEGFDVETGTVGGNTYRTGAFTEDDGTLEESIDVHEENRSSKTSQDHVKEMIKVINDLEEVSLNDDGASTTSVSSGSHSRSNSCDEQLIETARAAMTADAFRPDKSKIYDNSVKPDWASRSHVDSVVEATEAANESEDDQISVTTSYLKFIPSNLNLAEKDEGDDKVPEPDHAVESAQPALTTVSNSKIEEALVSTESPASIDKHKNDDNNTKPPWMNAQLRPITSKVSIPKDEVFSSFSSGANTEPEWMKKFKQMGLEKKD